MDLSKHISEITQLALEVDFLLDRPKDNSKEIEKLCNLLEFENDQLRSKVIELRKRKKN